MCHLALAGATGSDLDRTILDQLAFGRCSFRRERSLSRIIRKSRARTCVRSVCSCAVATFDCGARMVDRSTRTDAAAIRAGARRGNNFTVGVADLKWGFMASLLIAKQRSVCRLSNLLLAAESCSRHCTYL